MASSGVGSTQELSESRAQALQALFNSLAPGISSSQNDAKLTPDQARKISDKLDELLGDGVAEAESSGQRRNEKGELVNEEGLPIIDIVEPVSDAKAASGSTPIFDDPDLLPPWALSPAEKARRRAERERILDLLEEEELYEEERDEAAERERFKAELEKRKEAAKAEMENMKRARELQKRMGKALLRNVIDNKEREAKEQARIEQEEQEAREKTRLKPKKSVSFADLPAEGNEMDEGAPDSNLGDVSLAKLHRKGRTTLLTKAEIEKQPMKMNVVERHPSAETAQASATSIVGTHRDSDDESEVESAHDEAEDEDGFPSDVEPHSHSSPLLSDSEESDMEHDLGEEPIEWEEDEFDFARHQREIALAYYEKRASVGSEVLSAMRAHTHESEWDQPEPAASRFKTERTSSSDSSTLASHSLGPSVLPSSQSPSLQRVGDRLVGGEESDDDMLKRGEVTNGPADTATPGPSISKSTSDPSEPAKTAPRSKVSKFKLAFTQPQRVSRSDSSSPGAPPTPTSANERSSPKFAPPTAMPIHVPTSTSLPPRSAGDAPRNSTTRRLAVPPPGQGTNTMRMPSMIVESPSFRPPTAASVPTVLESPSFPGSARAPIPPTVISSPSFSAGPPPTARAGGTPPNVASPGPSAAGSVPERPPIVMAAGVTEKASTPRSTASAPQPAKSERKMSRFLAERLYE
ncbi:hypothetical protein OBBRIDRAFT_814126 [Obba rivulosa]|uniref:DUF3835 domain-containing protein n=1 Tax=Obba rivulosa TaxID=1052685 RepID=A0A8E2AXT5_9APHY|nr:hypothetical protein OBBRIDRAFT_814126 [Obba rivulosa]